MSAIILSLILFASYLTALLRLIYKETALLLHARLASLIPSLISSLPGIVMVGFYRDRGLYFPALAVSLVNLYWFYLLVKITELHEESEDIPDKIKLSWLDRS